MGSRIGFSVRVGGWVTQNNRPRLDTLRPKLAQV